MPLFLIERNFGEQLELDRETAAEITRVNAEEGVLWLYSFLRADNKKTYCLYEAPNPDALYRAARRLGLPADAIVAVGQISPGMYQ